MQVQLQAHHLIYNSMLDQARPWAFVEDFHLFGLACLLCLPLVLLFKRVRPGAKTIPAQ